MKPHRRLARGRLERDCSLMSWHRGRAAQRRCFSGSPLAQVPSTWIWNSSDFAGASDGQGTDERGAAHPPSPSAIRSAGRTSHIDDAASLVRLDAGRGGQPRARCHVSCRSVEAGAPASPLRRTQEVKNKLVAPWVSSVAEQTAGCLLDFHIWKSSADFTGSQAMSVLQQRSETIEPFFFNVAWFFHSWILVR